MNIQENISELKQFRQRLYGAFEARPDALMDLVDALASNTRAKSVVELSQNVAFRREYSSVHDAIDNLFQASSAEKAVEERQQLEQKLMSVIGSNLPKPTQRKYWLFAQDGTPVPRLFAPTLEDRSYVYQPNAMRGNKPVTIGHQYSGLVYLPERESAVDPAWVVPLSLQRVPSAAQSTGVGASQIGALLTNEALPFHKELCVLVVDSTYSVVPFLGKITQYENAVTVARARSNRVFYRQPPVVQGKRGKGHPRWYGERFALKEATTWGKPDAVATTTLTTRKGRIYQVQLLAWHDLLMRGKKDLPMHRHPFTLMRVRVLDEQGQPVFRRPMWLIVFGKLRQELSLVEAWQAYQQRFDEEHFLRFAKQRLLMTAYATPDVEHEENWMQIVQLAYVQLWLTRDLAQALPQPWERYLPQSQSQTASPSVAQRDFERIIRQIGTPAQPPQPRGKSPGRATGTRLPPRKRHPVVKKASKAKKRASKPA
jgi:hypothetical protein